jgi:hypothetical protein
MSDVFNTTFEESLRILIILNIVKDKASVDKIAALDFISIYGEDFGVSDYNLHGDNNYRFSEYASKRTIISKAVKELVLNGYIKPLCNKSGFSYVITKNGANFCDDLNNDYADSFKTIAEKTISKYLDYSDRKLTYCINEYAIAVFGGKEK